MKLITNLFPDLLTNAYDLVDSLTFTVRSISPSMWPIFELTYKLFKSEAEDFLEGALKGFQYLELLVNVFSPEMLPAIDNFISFGKDRFIQSPEYRAMAVDIYKTAMTSSHLGEADHVNGCKVAESLLLNLRGCLDDVCKFPIPLNF